MATTPTRIAGLIDSICQENLVEALPDWGSASARVGPASWGSRRTRSSAWSGTRLANRGDVFRVSNPGQRPAHCHLLRIGPRRNGVARAHLPALLLVLAACSPSESLLVERSEAVAAAGVEGQLLSIVIDHDDGTSATIHYLEPDVGDWVVVPSDSAGLSELVSGDRVRWFEGSVSLVDRTESLVRPIRREERILGIQLARSGGAPECTDTQVEQALFGSDPSRSIGAHLLAATDGRIVVRGVVVGPFEVEGKLPCDFGSYAQQAEAAIVAAGIDLNDYDRRMFFMPSSACGFAGIAVLNGARSWINGAACRRSPVILHELGHNLGMVHASQGGAEYGDRSDPQGDAVEPLKGYHGPHAIHLGLVDPERVVDVAQRYAGPLEALAGTPVTLGGPRVLRISAGPSEEVFVAHRGGVRYDVGLSTAYRDRISIHAFGRSRPTNTQLLGTLAAGETFVDVARGLTVTAGAMTSNIADVEVVQECRRLPMELTFIGDRAGARSGSRLERFARLRVRDGTACGPREVALEASDDTGLLELELDPPRLSLGPDAEALIRLVIQVPLSTPIGPTSIALTAHSDDPSPATAVMTLIVDDEAPTRPEDLTAIVEPIKSQNVALSWIASTDTQTEITYEVYRNGELRSQEMLRADPNGRVRTKEGNVPVGVYDYQVRAVDEAGNASELSEPARVVVRVRRGW